MISLGGMTYFVAIAAVMTYVSMVLIGKRHWQAREEGGSLGWHYFTVRSPCCASRGHHSDRAKSQLPACRH